MRNGNFIKSKGYIFTFAVFFIYLVSQFKKVYIYYDDYGYLSLSYGYVTESVVGDRYNIFQLIDFMYNHYLVANGRLLYAGLFPFVNMLGGILAIQIFMATVVFVIHFIIFYEIKKRNNLNNRVTFLLAIFLCLLYGLLSITIHRQGTYWFAASFLYVTPAIIFLFFSIMYYKTVKSDKEIDKKMQISLVSLAFIVGFSTEQWLSAGIIYIITVIGIKLYKKIRIKVYDICIFIFVILGALPILTSPAAKQRMLNSGEFANYSLFEKFTGNTNIIITNFFSNDHKAYLLVFIGALIVLVLNLLEKRKGFIWFNILYFLSSLLLLFSVATSKLGNLINSQNEIVFFILGYFILTIVQLYFFYKEENNFYPVLIFIAAFASIGCLILVPEIPVRAFIPFYLLSFLILGDIFAKIIGGAFNYAVVIIIIIMLMSIPNMKNIYDGYNLNDDILERNSEILYKSSLNGDTSVKLQKLNDILYGCEMLYYEGFEFMGSWMNEYYDLPEDFMYYFE